MGDPVEWQLAQLLVALAIPVALGSWPFVAPKKEVVLWHTEQSDALVVVLAGGRKVL